MRPSPAAIRVVRFGSVSSFLRNNISLLLFLIACKVSINAGHGRYIPICWIMTPYLAAGHKTSLQYNAGNLPFAFVVQG